MRTIVATMLALVIAALANSAFAAGTGMPMMKGLKSPTELATLVESSLASDPTGNKLLDPARCKKNGSCSTAHDYFYGIKLAHPSAKLENIAELPRYLRSLVKQPAPAGTWHLSRLLVRGGTHTYDAKGWERAFLHGEDVWVDINTGELILASDCGNVIGAVPTKPQPGPGPGLITYMPPGIGACPDFYLLKLNEWKWPALGLPGVEQTHAAEELAEKFVGPRVSRTHGKQFREAYASGKITRSATPRLFQVSLIMTPEASGGLPTITEELVLGNITVKGLKELRFTLAQLQKWDAIRIASVNGDQMSPPPYHLTGLHELRFFNHLPGTTLGEWDANPVPDCIMNEHWIELDE